MTVTAMPAQLRRKGPPRRPTALTPTQQAYLTTTPPTPDAGTVCRYASDIKPLRRARGWSQGKVAAALRQVARARGTEVPGLESLTRMVRCWERGDRGLSEFYALLLGEVFGEPFEQGRPGAAKQTALGDYRRLLEQVAAVDRDRAVARLDAYIADLELLRQQWAHTGQQDG